MFVLYFIILVLIAAIFALSFFIAQRNLFWKLQHIVFGICNLNFGFFVLGHVFSWVLDDEGLLQEIPLERDIWRWIGLSNRDGVVSGELLADLVISSSFEVQLFFLFPGIHWNLEIQHLHLLPILFLRRNIR